MSRPTYPVDTLSKLFSLTPRRVQQLAKEGIIPKAERGKYDLIGSVQGYVRYLQSNADGKKDTTDVKQERGRLLKAQADKTELEVATLKGNLISLDVIELEWSKITTSFRSRLLALPSRAAVLSASLKDIHAIEDVFRELIHEALTELSRYDPKDATQEDYCEDSEEACSAS